MICLDERVSDVGQVSRLKGLVKESMINPIAHSKMQLQVSSEIHFELSSLELVENRYPHTAQSNHKVMKFVQDFQISRYLE